MLNWALRYRPVVELLEPFRPRVVLDVGSGWHGVGRWRSGPVVQTDLAFGGGTRPDSNPASTSYVASTAERLPFPDGSFDFAVSVDMVEHLPEDIRAPALDELLRVASKGVVVGFPVGETARSVDERIARALRVTHRGVPAWLDEHLAQRSYPDGELVRSALRPGWVVTEERISGNVRFQPWLVLTENLPVLRRVGRRTRTGGGFPRSVQLISRLLDRGQGYRTVWLLLRTEVQRS